MNLEFDAHDNASNILDQNGGLAALTLCFSGESPSFL